jgi:hypothetical protein
MIVVTAAPVLLPASPAAQVTAAAPTVTPTAPAPLPAPAAAVASRR